MDNKSFVYNIDPIRKDVLFVSQIHLLKTKHFLISEGDTFFKFPYLHTLSSIVDNCSQFILNREIVTKTTINKLERRYYDEKGKVKKNTKTQFKSFVSPNEMCLLIQTFNKIVPQLDTIKSLIKDIKDEDLKRFFIILFIKLSL